MTTYKIYNSKFGISPELQYILNETVTVFENKRPELRDGIEYWSRYLNTRDLGNTIFDIVKKIAGESRCGDYVQIILTNFDYFKMHHLDLHFPIEFLGRCRITAKHQTSDCKIPYYDYADNKILEWGYHEVIVIINNADLVSGKPLATNAKIYDIVMNKMNTLTVRGHRGALVPSRLLHNIAPKLQIPDTIILDITHRHRGFIDSMDKWHHTPNRKCYYDI